MDWREGWGGLEVLRGGETETNMYGLEDRLADLCW